MQPYWGPIPTFPSEGEDHDIIRRLLAMPDEEVVAFLEVEWERLGLTWTITVEDVQALRNSTGT
jgi:hypothetical protein